MRARTSARPARLRYLRYRAATLVFATFFFAECIAWADEREQCAASAEQAQQLRDDGKYRRAREQMLSCARDVCPGPIKSDCGKWLSELERDAPTVVFGAHDVHGVDIVDVKVLMDGAPLLTRLDGRPVLVDAGEHTFRFESKDGVKEERVLLRAAEKARPIVATFPGAPDKSVVTPAPDHPMRPEGSIVPAVVLGSIGVLALGSFAVFGLSGKGDVDNLKKCKPNCAQKDVDHARTKLLIADVSLVGALIAIGVGAYLFFTRSHGTSETKLGSISFDATGLRGRF